MGSLYIEVVAVTSNEKNIQNCLDGFPFIPKNRICECEYDYCLVAIKKLGMSRIKKEALELGIPIEKIIPIKVLCIPYFDFRKYIELKKSNLSIICSNCWGGVVYSKLGLEFLSPTINMFIKGDQFNKFVGDLKYYLAQPVKYKCTGFNPDLNIEYPIGLIDDIELYFNHTTDFNEAVTLWDKRKQRVNFDNLLIVSYSEFNEEVIQQFEHLDYKNKIMFTCLETKSPNVIHLHLYIPTRQSTLHGVLVHSFRRYSARFPVISA